MVYRIKQSPRAWYKKIDQYFELIDLKKSHAILRNATLSFIIALYVNDLFLSWFVTSSIFLKKQNLIFQNCLI